MDSLWRLSSIDLYITTVCNLKCDSCFLGDDYFSQRVLMTPESAGAIATWAKQEGAHEVAILGGEPTTHPGLVSILHSVKDSGLVRIRLVSNGGPTYVRALKNGVLAEVDEIYLSIDGATADSHDAVRGAGSFVDVLASADATIAAGKPLVVTSTLSRFTYTETAAIAALAERIGAVRLNIHWLSPTGRASTRDMTADQSDWSVAVRDALSYEPKRNDFRVDIQRGFGTERLQCAVSEKTNLQFMPDGRVHACGLTVDSAELASWEWRDGSLIRRRSLLASELEIVEADNTAFCPIRMQVLGERPTHGLGPVCVYERCTNNS
jgi:MoaA/NifB/PqqE/SkfB family radical SAM enzyme